MMGNEVSLNEFLTELHMRRQFISISISIRVQERHIFQGLARTNVGCLGKHVIALSKRPSGTHTATATHTASNFTASFGYLVNVLVLHASIIIGIGIGIGIRIDAKVESILIHDESNDQS